MAIIYTYPQINSSSDLAASDLMIISDMSANGRPTKSLTLKNLADFITTTGTGTGTTNAIIKWSDGPSGLLGDSIMTENATQIDLAGTFLSTSSPTGTSGPIHGIRANQTSTATGAFNIALYGDSKHTGANKGSYNYGLYTKAEFEGTNGYDGVLYGAYTEARYDGSGTNATWSSLYGAQAKARVTGTATGDLGYMIGNNISSVMDTGTAVDVEFLQGQHTNVTFNSGNVSGSIAVNLLDFDYPGGGTLQGDFAYLQIQNDPVPTPVAGTARAINSDSTLPSHFSGVVEIPLIPTANSHATSKQYVDQQIASIPAGLVFQGNWNANTNTPALASGTGTVGNYYVVSVAGNTNLDGITDWEVGDWAVFVEVGGVDKWDKIDQTFVQGAGANGQVSFWSGVNSVTGDNDFYWDNVNKRLGIGTTSPSQKLDVVGNINLDGTSTRVFFGGNNTFVGENSNSNELILRGGGSTTTESVYIDTSGNVGIGTSNPSYKLDVVKDGGNAILNLERTGTNSGKTLFSVENQGRLRVISEDSIRFLTPGGERIHIEAGGNVGIGTSSPSSKLQVNAGTENLVAEFESTDSISEIRIKDNTAYSRLLNVGAQLKLMPNNGVEMMIIDGNTNTVNVPDDKTLTFGANNDLVIQHNSGASLNQIDNINGDLYIQQNANDKDIIFRSDDGSGGLTEYFRIDGGTERIESSKSFRFADGARVQLGSGSDMQIHHTGSSNFIEVSSGGLTIRQNTNDGDISFQSDDGSGGVATYFYLDGSATRTQFDQDVMLIGGGNYIQVDNSDASIKFADDVKVKFGTGNDLQIFHETGSTSKIENYTGNLTIQQRADDSDIVFQCDDGSGGLTEYFRIDGSSEYNIFSKDLYITDNVTLRIGTGQDLRIYHNGTNNFIEAYSGNLIIQNQTDDSDVIFKCDNGSGGTTEYFKLDGGDTITRVARNFRANDNVALQVGVDGDAGMYHDGTNTYIQNDTGDLYIRNNSNDKDIILQSDDGSGGVTSYLKLWGAIESLAVYKDMLFVNDGNGGKLKFGASQDLQIYHDGSDSYINETGTGDLIVKAVDDVYIRGNTHDMGRFNEQGVKLYYLGGVKLETNNTGVKIPTAGNGLQLVSPNGTVYTVTVDNSGNLTVT